MAPATSRSSQVTGLPFLSWATTIRPIRSRRSFKSLNTARIAITSLDTAMLNLLCMA